MATRRYANIVMDSARWDHVALRDDDIVVSTPPKCGTTWMQTCCALLVFRTPELPRPLAELSPWVDMLTWPLDELVAQVEGHQHRRILKTHTPLDGLPWHPTVTYLCVGRDPRDAALSWDNHLANTDGQALMTARITAVGMEGIDFEHLPFSTSDDEVERFWQWIEGAGAIGDDPMIGLASLLRHIGSFWARRDEPNVHLFHYADLKADLPGEMRRLAGTLGIEIDDDELAVLAEAATFDQMKARSSVLAPDTTHNIWLDTARFFDKARTGGWRAIDGADGPRYLDRLAELAPADGLAAWLHAGAAHAGAATPA